MQHRAYGEPWLDPHDGVKHRNVLTQGDACRMEKATYPEQTHPLSTEEKLLFQAYRDEECPEVREGAVCAIL